MSLSGLLEARGVKSNYFGEDLIIYQKFTPKNELLFHEIICGDLAVKFTITKYIFKIIIWHMYMTPNNFFVFNKKIDLICIITKPN